MISRIRKFNINGVVMKISSVNWNIIYNKNNNCNCLTGPIKAEYQNKKYNVVNNSNVKNISNTKNNYSQLSFLGYKVYILDGGFHAQNLLHFAKALSNDIEPIIKDVKINTDCPKIKNLKDLEQVIEQLPLKNNLYSQYVAIPASVPVSISKLQEQLNKVMKTDISLTPENIKTYKPLILNFLQKLYEKPSDYIESINSINSQNFDIENTYGVINQINNLIKNHYAKVYLPVEHPFDNAIKKMIEQRNLKYDFHNFLATGEDKTGCIKSILEEVKTSNEYNFNLLTLSNARNITVKDRNWNKNYVFSGYDSCITDGARGVYNFSPIRDSNKKLVGYSYTDTVTNEYPIEKFPNFEKVRNLSQYVGLDANDVVANEGEIIQYKSRVYKNKLLNKLYPVKELFSEYEISGDKLKLKGDYTDCTRKLFFTKNNQNKIVFSDADCEGSGKPSVMSMWGSCFAMFNAIKNDIYYDKLAQKLYSTNGKSYGLYLLLKEQVMEDLLNKARDAYKNKDFSKAEAIYNEAVNASIASEKYGFADIRPYIEQGEMFFKLYNFNNASGCFNTAINKLSRNIKGCLSNLDLKFIDLKLQYENQQKYVKEYNDVLKIAEIYKKLSIICSEKGQIESAIKCFKASEEIKNFTITGEKLISRRADCNMYIGDIL